MQHPLVPKLLAALAAVALVVTLVPGVSLAAGRFVDVETGGPYTADIQWMAEHGITAGCEIDRYCPKSAVTREQMATFMNRLATSGVVDAATVGGLTADELRGATGAEGPIGPEGPQGPAGPAGPQGPAGLVGITTRTVTEAAVAVGTQGTVTAGCAVGETVIGGGFSTSSSNMTVTESAPSGSSGWTVSAHNGGSASASLSAHAICATLSS